MNANRLFMCRQVCQRFRHERQLGVGAFGDVWLAFDDETKAWVAVKWLLNDAQDEIATHLALQQSTYIVRLLDHGTVVFDDWKASFLVLEYCQRDLRQLLARGPFTDPALVKDVMRQLLRGVAEMHELGILHVDIKCSNILVKRNLHVVLADLGLSCRETDDAKATRCAGTITNIAPEVLLGAAASRSSDMWAVGCVCAELCSGGRLFNPSTLERERRRNQLIAIFQRLGTPDCYTQLPLWQPFDMYPQKDLPNRWGEASLLAAMLCYKPRERISARQALRHPFLQQ